MRLCWQVELTSRARGEKFRVLVDARSGEVLLRHGLTVYVSPASYRVFTSDSPTPFSPGHPTPLTNQPPLVSRSLVTWPALDTNASPAGWIDEGENETRGNNVDAHLDRDANDQPDLPRPQGSPFRVFDFPMDLAQPPADYGAASVVQLFYWCNWMHDRLYALGFTEAAGNFQTTNFGRGGWGGDAVVADAQDGSGFNNANYTSTADGFAPRIQMYLFDGPTPARDGDLDAEIVLHEYTHGLSDRLVGGGIGISAPQSSGLAEGWSDFYALALLSEPADDPGGNYAAAGYASYLLRGLRESYYFGLRRYPYSTSLSRNPLTFKDIDPAQASAHPDVPLNPIANPFNPAKASEVHNQGEVWCVTLWEMRANLIARHGFAAGNPLALQLATDGMKLSPPNPTFLEARDAILAADRVDNRGANFQELWQAFAKRGLGFHAIAPSASTTAGVVESFDLPDDLRIAPADRLAARGPLGGPFSPIAVTFTLTNAGTNALTWSLIHTSAWLSASQSGGLLAPGDPSTALTVAVNGRANQLPAGSYTDTIQFTNQTSGVLQGRTFTLRAGQPDFYTELLAGSRLDLGYRQFTFTPDGSASYYSVCPGLATIFPTDPSAGNPAAFLDDGYMPVTLSGDATVSIYGHRTNVFFIGSNGYLTTDSGDDQYVESIPNHFRLRRVAALFDDLDPSAGGLISWQQLSNRVAVTFLNVPHYDSPHRTNSFQIELFFDGRLRLTYLNVATHDVLVGLSGGQGVPVAFAESDFNSYPPCVPALQVDLPATVTEGDGLLAGRGRVRLMSPATEDLVVSLTSLNPAEVTVLANVTIPAGQADAAFDATVVDDTKLDGTQFATIVATAANYNPGSASIGVVDNESATLSLFLPTVVNEGDGLVQSRLTLSAPAAANIAVSLSASDPSRVRVPAWVFIQPGQTSLVFDVTVAENVQIEGSQAVTVTATVRNWAGATATLTVLDNEALRLAVKMPSRVDESDRVLHQAASARLTGTLPTNLVVTLACSDPTQITIPANVTIPAGQIAAFFDLAIVDDPVLNGSRSVTVTAGAPGFSSGSATTTVLDDESPPMPSGPLPAHLATNVATTTGLAWFDPQGETITNGGFETGDFTGWVQTNSGKGAFRINDGTADPFGVDGPLPPFSGRFSVLSHQAGLGIYMLYQDLAVPRAGTPVLAWAQRIRNHGTAFASNQSFRVEIRDTSNELQTVAFSTQPGDPLLTDWTEQNYDLFEFRGRKIRLAFVEQNDASNFNAHLDDVQMTGGTAGPPVTNEVYFGTNPAPGPAEYQGTTTDATWALPLLIPGTTYYWQVVARRLGATPGPVWQFTTREAEPTTVSVSQSNAVVTLRWNTTAGATYRVEFKPDLAGSNWSPLGGLITATGATMSQADINSADQQRFYRVVRLP
jgi:hypothetical protein